LNNRRILRKNMLKLN